MKRGRSMTVAEHVATGRMLKEQRDKIDGTWLNRYPKQHVCTRRLRAAGRAIDRLRCALDSLAAKEYPESFDARWYYPGSQPTLAIVTLSELASDPANDDMVRFDARRKTFDFYFRERHKRWPPGRRCEPDYWFDLNRCHTPQELVAWLVHLSEKTWFVSTLQREFVELWEQVTVNKIPYGI